MRRGAKERLPQKGIHTPKEGTWRCGSRSAWAKVKAKYPLQIQLWEGVDLLSLRYGYDADDEAGRWIDGPDDEYVHEEENGITHLKRPDHFPPIHEHILPFRCPSDVGLNILSYLDGPSLPALQLVSRAWRDTMCCRLAQRCLWYPLARQYRFTPTDTDWTRSAEAVRQTRSSPARRSVVDWRRHYKDCWNSLNMRNRTRIFRAVWNISHRLGHCGCKEGSPTCRP
ncbi:hypothetical protein PUNSTDRAFT_137883 [Punctularia strigosozonata HHB-11173 SS5]|uniref:F-box domain-containing protein n=1 Tax=Punctularia strigosozonata (strain HHB-11173) TaxID=741275 RepID=R7S5X0_PUNST|nr:uncharacterized protein PUNSTDRAFT_137883 [Punctularia strigosozonata HHB-11173 SS5]EIN05201.1 hypothetical protein PUNSTDRAFT_137883 [Punctularia strigosozonata HHB-11173 SS5]